MTIHADKNLKLDKHGNLTMAAQLMEFIKENPMYKKDLIDGPIFSLFTGNISALSKLHQNWRVIFWR